MGLVGTKADPGQTSQAKARSGRPVDQTILASVEFGTAHPNRAQTHETQSIPIEDSGTLGLTLGEICDAYMSDPTRD